MKRRHTSSSEYPVNKSCQCFTRACLTSQLVRRRILDWGTDREMKRARLPPSRRNSSNGPRDNACLLTRPAQHSRCMSSHPIPTSNSSIMPDDQPGYQNLSIPASQASPLLTSFTTFLTLAIHSLLYHRTLYAPETFLTARAYNLPVRQSRHPGVCTWVTDAVTAVGAQLQRAAVDRVVFVIHAPRSLCVLERWVFDVARFPEWGSDEGNNGGGGEVEEEHVNWTDVNEALRGALYRLAYAAEKMPRLPEGCTFTLAVELRDEASAPIGVCFLVVISCNRTPVDANVSSILRNGSPRNQTSNRLPGGNPKSSPLQRPEPKPRRYALSKPALYSLSAGSSSQSQRPTTLKHGDSQNATSASS